MRFLSFFDQKIKNRVWMFVVLHFLGALLEGAGISLIFPLISMLVASNVSKESVVLCSLFVFGCYLTKNIYLYVVSVWQRKFILSGYIGTVKKIFACYLAKPFSYFFGKDYAVLLNNVNVYVGKAFICLEIFMNLISEVLVVCLLFAIMCVVSTFASVMTVLLFGVLVFGFIRFFRQRLRETEVLSNKSYDNMMKIVLETFSSIETVKAFCKEKAFYDRYCEQADSNGKLEMRKAVYMNVLKHIIEMVAVCGMLSIMLLSYGKVSQEIFLPRLVVFAAVIVRLVPGLIKVNDYFFQLNIYGVLLSRSDGEFVEMFGSSPSTAAGCDGEYSFREAIVLENITFGYSETVPVLENINLKIRKGTTVGFCGPSGIGKTTLLRLIMGLLEPSEGTIGIDGINLKNLGGTVQRNIGYVSQTIHLLRGSIKDNILFFRKYDKDKFQRVLTISGVQDFIGKLSGGVDTDIGEQGTCLSGGQMQRIGIARALYDEPDILVLDEATSFLDRENEKKILRNIFTSKKRNTTVLVSAHRFTNFEYCDDVYELRDGCLIKKLGTE